MAKYKAGKPAPNNRVRVLATQQAFSKAGRNYTAADIAHELGISDSTVRKYWDDKKARQDGAAKEAPKPGVKERRKQSNARRAAAAENEAVQFSASLSAVVLDVRSTYVPKSSDKQYTAPFPNDRAYATVYGPNGGPLPSPRAGRVKTAMFVADSDLNEVAVPSTVTSFGKLDEQLRVDKPGHRVLPISRVDDVLVVGEPTYGQRVGVLVTKGDDDEAQAELDAYIAWKRGESFGFIGVEPEVAPLHERGYATREAAERAALDWALKEPEAE